MEKELHAGAFIPVLNEADGIYDSILGLDDQTHPIERLHIVDGGSDDATLEEIDRARDEVPFDITVTVKDGAGIRTSSQIGAEDIAQWLIDEYGDGIVLRTDGDSTLAPNFLKEAAEALSDPDNSVFGAPVAPHQPEEGRIKKSMFQALQNADQLPKGRGMAFRAQDFFEVDGYRMTPDEDIEDAYLDCMEDGVITAKLADIGNVVFSDNTTVYSTIPSTTASSLDRWKKAALIEARMGPTKYFTRIGNPLWVARHTGRKVRDRLELPFSLTLSRRKDRRAS